MLVFITCFDGKRRLAGSCAIPAPPHSGMCVFDRPAQWGYKTQPVTFRSRLGKPPIDVIVLDEDDDPRDLPGFCEVEGRA